MERLFRKSEFSKSIDTQPVRIYLHFRVILMMYCKSILTESVWRVYVSFRIFSKESSFSLHFLYIELSGY